MNYTNILCLYDLVSLFSEHSPDSIWGHHRDRRHLIWAVAAAACRIPAVPAADSSAASELAAAADGAASAGQDS